MQSAFYRCVWIFVLAVLVSLQWQPTRADAAPASAACSYTVRAGDTLSAIARRYNSTVSTIATASAVRNPNLIYVGQVLTIPNCSSDEAPAPPTTATPSGPTVTVIEEDKVTTTEGDLRLESVRTLRQPPADLSEDLQKRVDSATVQLVILRPDRFGIATGTVVGVDGHTILTAFHVVGDPQTGETHPSMDILVGPYKGYTLEATVVATDPAHDLAVIRIERRSDFGGFTFLPLANSDASRLGEPMYVFSYPARREGGLARTKGNLLMRLSNVGDGLRRAHFTDAQASAGSSGGVAVNAQGEVMGIVNRGVPLVRGVDRPGLPTLTQLTGVIPINFAVPLLNRAATE